MRQLTRNAFQDLKADYPIYGTHTAEDKYKNRYTVKDDDPKCTVHTVWHPISDAVSAAEYGPDIASMYYAIIYEDVTISYNDVVILFGDEYEVVGVKHFNTHVRVDVKRKKV